MTLGWRTLGGLTLPVTSLSDSHRLRLARRHLRYNRSSRNRILSICITLSWLTRLMDRTRSCKCGLLPLLSSLTGVVHTKMRCQQVEPRRKDALELRDLVQYVRLAAQLTRDHEKLGASYVRQIS